MRAFQLNVLYRILATRRMLKIWGIERTNECRFCVEETEDLSHLFWYCPHVVCFWNGVQNWLLNCNISSYIDIQTVLLGDLKEYNLTFVNMIILLGKRFIFKAQCIHELQLERFKRQVKHHSTIEGLLAQGNDSLEAFRDRWSSLREAEEWE